MVRGQAAPEVLASVLDRGDLAAPEVLASVLHRGDLAAPEVLVWMEVHLVETVVLPARAVSLGPRVIDVARADLTPAVRGFEVGGDAGLAAEVAAA